MEVDKIDLTGQDINDQIEPQNGDDKTPPTGGDDGNPDNKDLKDNPDPKDNSDNPDTKDKSDKSNDDNSSTGELTEGTIVEYDGKSYTVDKDGNIVDDKGTIFKEAKDVKDWLKEMNVNDSNDNNNNDDNKSFDIAKLQEQLGITITDEKGKTIEFSNDAAGVKSYIDSVMELRTKEIQEAAVNKLFNDNPLIKQFNDYVAVTGSAKGFGDLPDRSKIKLDKDNTTQQEYIIRMAAEEFGNKSMSDNYIKYLKDSNGLYEEAKSALASLVKKDEETRKYYEEQAATNKAQQEKEIKEYWDSIKTIVDSGSFAGFKIPDTIIKEQDGKKISYNRNDFFNYMYKPAYKDENGNPMTGYQRDLNNLNDKDYKERQLLDAYLLFKGATYKDLAQLAVKEDAVRKLKVTANTSETKKTVKITPKHNSKVDVNDILF